VAVATLYRGAYSASNLEIIPDSVEYALAGHRLVTEGRYSILVGGRDLPPRYLPWFSLFVAAPAYAVLGPDLGNAIFPVTVLALFGVMIAFTIGHRIGGAWGGAIAALAVLVLPDYRQCGRLILTDVPTSALLIGSCAVYLWVRRSARTGTLGYLLGGVLIAAAALLRPISVTAAMPFVLAAAAPPRPKIFGRLAALISPLAAGAAATLAYNEVTFGSPWRSGYHFWCPVPFDYPALVFSLSYVGTNLGVVWSTGLPLIAIGGVSLFVAPRPTFCRPAASGEQSDERSLAEFLVLGTGPMVPFYLVYFFPMSRFFLPPLVVAAVLLGSLLGARLGRIPRSALLAALAALFVEAVGLRYRTPEGPPRRRLAANRIETQTPSDAIIISAIEPAYLEYLVARGSRRRVLPISRDIEYANKLIAPHRVPNPAPPPATSVDHRCPGLLNGGAQEAVAAVAAERLDAIEEAVRLGTPVFVDTSAVGDSDRQVVRRIQERFSMIPRSADLFELRSRR